ncbi:2581_t:CDS:2 [Ambispora gerdemannii]|uniref:2581_t:CDS:1 n=1 Tax=Ambispora gerdemannii TaxID=144530 RepID=A0A9N9BBA1_9GLOM|nr:2581_t:CDS:2 [Ambispora gerdemannii]
MSEIDNNKVLIKEIEKIANNKRKQQTECEEDPQPLLTTTEDSVKKEDRSKKRYRINVDDAAVNDQMDWTSSTYSDQVASNLASLAPYIIAKSTTKNQITSPQPLLTTGDSERKEDMSKKRSRINVDDAINDQMDWTSSTYSDQVESNLASLSPKSTTENQIINQQQIDEEKNETAMNDLLILFENSFKYNENCRANLIKFATVLFITLVLMLTKIMIEHYNIISH